MKTERHGIQKINGYTHLDIMLVKTKKTCPASPGFFTTINALHLCCFSMNCGKTENFPPEYLYILVAVDVPKTYKFWKKHIAYPNTMYKTSFYEEGPNEEIIVSIYAIDDATNAVINQWFKENKISGIPILPKECCLDSITLKLI